MKFLPIFFLLLAACLNLQAGTLSASTDRNHLGSNETLTLTVQYNESTVEEPDTRELEQQFSILGRSKSSNIQIINGNISTTATWQYELSPLKSGTLTIPKFTIDNDASEAITIEVSGKSANAAATNQQNIYTETELDKDSVFVQQQAIITWRLVSRYNIIEPQFSPPNIDGVLLQDLGSRAYQRSSPEGYIERIVEQSYALFPQKSGIITIPAQQFQLVIDTPQRTNKGYFRPQRSQIRVSTDEKSITVTPANNPQGRAWLPATSMNISQEMTGTGQNNTVTAGTAFTRVIKIRAEGLSAEQLPPVDMQADGIKVYSEPPVLKNETSATALTGVREDKAAIIATRPGKLVLPSVSIPWYDISTNTWKSALLPETSLDVIPAAGNSMGDANTSNPAKNTAPVMPDAADSSTVMPAAVKTPATSSQSNTVDTEYSSSAVRKWQIATGILAFILLITIVIFFRRQSFVPNTPLTTTGVPQAHTGRSLRQAATQSDVKSLHRELTLWANSETTHREILQHPSIAPTFQALEKHLYGNGPLPDPEALKRLPDQLESLLTDRQQQDSEVRQLENLYR